MRLTTWGPVLAGWTLVLRAPAGLAQATIPLCSGLTTAGRPRPTPKTKRPGSLPGASPFSIATAAYRSSSTAPAGTSCGWAGSSTRGGGAS
jgi:hypothetical protein